MNAMRSIVCGAAALALPILALPTAPVHAQRRLPPPSREIAQYSFAPIVKKAAPAVVNVYVRSRVQEFQSPFANDPFFGQIFGNRFGVPVERMQNSLGSGVIVSADGIVVTNNHVIKSSGASEIKVVLADKREFDAKVVLADDKSDLAILRIAGGDRAFPFLEFEDSDQIEVGDMVLAIGNPFGVGQTVTSGIISALARGEISTSDTQVFLQTDAAINPGNSGGALVDMAGRVVGINTAIFSPSGGSNGIGFAIPSNLVRLYVESAVSGKKVERPWLGAKLDPMTREIADALGLDRVSGAVVSRITDKGPAALAGLEPGDVVLMVDSYEVSDPRTVYYRLTTRGIGNRSRLEVVRKGRRVAIEVALEAPPQAAPGDVRNLSGNHPFDGARVANIRPAIADQFGIEDAAGVVVLSVRAGSVAANLGFQAGDIIVQIGRDKIASLADVDRQLKDRQRVWAIAVKRGDRVLQLQMPG